MQIFLFLILALSSACTPLVGQRIERAEALAAQGGLEPQFFPGALPLAGWSRRGSGPLWVFLEGDGLAWLSPTRPSMNPTPLNPVGLRLAMVDPADNVLYLARPGQFLPTKDVAAQYWLEARFAPEVVDAVTKAVQQHASASGTNEVVLAGYSGGAALAVLVAAQLQAQRDLQVLGLVTVAGNIDHDIWTQRRNLSPLSASMNPADVAKQLVSVPQRHLVGTKDEQVPAYVLDSFLQRSGSDRCIEVRRYPLGHDGPWEEVWRMFRHAGSLSCRE